MNKEEFIKEVEKLGIKCSLEQMTLSDKYCNYLLEYNKHTNLTAIREEKEVYLKHFYDSLTITKVIDLNQIDNFLDIGSGAGFPGIVIKIFFPSIHAVLIDSNNKKTKFLTSLVEYLDLQNIEIINDRVENIYPKYFNSFSLVTARAVTNLRVLSELALPLVKVNGYFIPMKAQVEEELNEAKYTITKLNAKIISQVEFELYNKYGIRTLLKIIKLKESNLSNLRTYEKIIKKPL